MINFRLQQLTHSGAPSSRCKPTSIIQYGCAKRLLLRSAVSARATFNPPPVSDTKRKFLEGYRKPIAPIYNTVIQELLVQMHFIRHSLNYEYNPIYALGFISVFDQVLDSLDADECDKIFTAYLQALGEDADKFRRDAATMEQIAASLPGPEALVPDASGSKLQQALAHVSDRTAAGTFSYNRYFAIGIFRLLELTGAHEPSALERLVGAVGVKVEAVNRDLLLYKGVLSKVSAARELAREGAERDKRKAAERAARKAAEKMAEGMVAEGTQGGSKDD